MKAKLGCVASLNRRSGCMPYMLTRLGGCHEHYYMLKPYMLTPLGGCHEYYYMLKRLSGCREYALYVEARVAWHNET
jgi:hypothetical protein